MIYQIEEIANAKLKYNAMIMSSIQLFVYNNGLIDLHNQGIDCGYIVSDMVCNVFGKLGYRFMKQWDGNYIEMIDCAIESGQYN